MLHNVCTISNEPRDDLTAKLDTNLKGVSISGQSIPNLIDEIPLIAILAMFAEGKTTIRDAKELRYKESDRIKEMPKKWGGGSTLKPIDVKKNPEEDNSHVILPITLSL